MAAAVYAGVTFKVEAEQGLWRTHWTQEVKSAELTVPYADGNIVQYGGLGDLTLDCAAVLSADGDLEALQAAQGATRRTLTWFGGQSWANVNLHKVGAPRRWDGGATWRVSLVFRRSASGT